MDDRALMELIHVTKRFGTQVVLDDISCRIPRAKTTVFVGPSGVGKSSLIKLMVGLHAPDAGRILFDGRDLTTQTRKGWFAARRRMGMLFQDAALFDSMTVFENVAFPLRHHRKLSEREIHSLVEARLKDVGLGNIEHKFPGELSGGMRKRVALARALVLDPDVIFFDEPTSGLDPVTAAAIDDLILQTRARLATTFVVISHDIVSTRRIADTVGMLFRGRLVEFGPAEQLLQSTDPVLRQFFDRKSEGPIQLI